MYILFLNFVFNLVIVLFVIVDKIFNKLDIFVLFFWLYFIIGGLLLLVIVCLIFFFIDFGFFKSVIMLLWLLFDFDIFLVGLSSDIICVFVFGINILGIVNIGLIMLFFVFFLLYNVLKWLVILRVILRCCFWLLFIGIWLVW